MGSPMAKKVLINATEEYEYAIAPAKLRMVKKVRGVLVAAGTKRRRLAYTRPSTAYKGSKS